MDLLGHLATPNSLGASLTADMKAATPARVRIPKDRPWDFTLGGAPPKNNTEPKQEPENIEEDIKKMAQAIKAQAPPTTSPTRGQRANARNERIHSKMLKQLRWCREFERARVGRLQLRRAPGRRSSRRRPCFRSARCPRTSSQLSPRDHSTAR